MSLKRETENSDSFNPNNNDVTIHKYYSADQIY